MFCMTLPYLLLDSGNTRLKYALYDGASIKRQGALPQQDVASFLVEAQKLPPLQGVLGCNVAGEQAAARIAQALPAYTIQWATPRRQCAGVTTHYEDLQRLGPDRWLSVLAARRRLTDNLLVVNAGTALTIDCITAAGDYLGGTICPGWRLMRDALALQTAHLGRPDGVWQAFPTNTSNAIISGILNALVGAIEQQARQLQARAGSVEHCLLSGGDADLLAPYLSIPVVQVENLVLEGLRVLSHVPLWSPLEKG
jgi:type III pantothenate kinase